MSVFEAAAEEGDVMAGFATAPWRREHTTPTPTWPTKEDAPIEVPSDE